MKLTHTKKQVKTIGSDIKDIGKATLKLGKDTFKTPSSLFADIRQHRAMMKAFHEWQSQQSNPDTDPLA